MDLVEYFVQFLTELCEGTRKTPPGLVLTETEEEARATQLQPQIQAIGVPAFVRLCAMDEGLEIPEEVFTDFQNKMLARSLEDIPTEELPEPTPTDVPSEIRDIYEVFLDSICLEDVFIQYLIDVLRRGAKDEFEKLSQAAARSVLDMDDFLAWLGNKELLGPVEEQAAARILDECFARLWAEGERELLAALLSGDEQTFCTFRCEAPELIHIPEATYEWFCKYYLDCYYPIRFLLKCNGITFPTV